MFTSTSSPQRRIRRWSLDRLVRNTLHILKTVKALTGRHLTLVFTVDGIDSSTAAGRMMIGVRGSLAEYERELTKQRTALKQAASRDTARDSGAPRMPPTRVASRRQGG